MSPDAPEAVGDRARSVRSILMWVGSALLFAVVMFMSMPMGTGSATYARRWQARLAPLASSDEATALYPDVQARTFPDGGWIFGVTDDSHASMFGGTVVIKDSRGGLHTWFGHVCGPRYLRLIGPSAATLDEFLKAAGTSLRAQPSRPRSPDGRVGGAAGER